MTKIKWLCGLILIVQVATGSSLGAAAANAETIVKVSASSETAEKAAYRTKITGEAVSGAETAEKSDADIKISIESPVNSVIGEGTAPDAGSTEEAASEAVSGNESATDTGKVLWMSDTSDAGKTSGMSDTSDAGKSFGMSDTSDIVIEVENASVIGVTSEASGSFPETSAEVVPVRLPAEDLPGEGEIIQSIIRESKQDPWTDSGEGQGTDTEESMDLNPDENLQTNLGEELNDSEDVQADLDEGWTTDAEKDVEQEVSDQGASEESIHFYPNDVNFNEAETEFAEPEEDSTASGASESVEGLTEPEAVGSEEGLTASEITEPEEVLTAPETEEPEEGLTAPEPEESLEGLTAPKPEESLEGLTVSESEETGKDWNASVSGETSPDTDTAAGGQKDVEYLYAPATVRLFQKEIIPKPEEICLTEKSPRVLNRHSVYITHNRSCRLLKEEQDYEIVRENSGGGYAYSYRIFASNFAREGSYAVTVCSLDRNGRMTTNAIRRSGAGADSASGAGDVKTGNSALGTGDVNMEDNTPEAGNIKTEDSASGAGMKSGDETENGTGMNALDVETSGRPAGEIQIGEASGQSAAEALAVDTSARSSTDTAAEGSMQDSFSPGFIVDGTAPTCTIAGLRSENTTISGEKMNVTILPRDNVSVEEVCIRVNDEEEQKYIGEELEAALAEGNGGIRVPIRTSMAAQTIAVRVTDSAGNESGECTWKFTLSRRDSAGLRSAAAASVSMAAVSAVILIMVVYRKKKMGIAKPEQM